MEFLRLLSGIRNGFLDKLMLLLTELGSEIIILGLVCLLYWCVSKRAAYRLGAVFFVSGILVQGLKISFHIERPWVLDPSFSPVEAAKPGASGYSFPSGHTQGGTALYGTGLIKLKRVSLKIICAVLIVVVAFSRMYLGVHTPLDVGVALALTFICVILVNRLFDAIENDKSRDGVICIILASVSVALCLYSYILASAGIIDRAQINDCFKSGGAGLAFALGFYLERSWLNFSERTEKLWMQAVKLLCGIAGALLLKELPKLIAEGNLIIDFLRYFLTVGWVMIGFPLLFTRILNRRRDAAERVGDKG